MFTVRHDVYWFHQHAIYMLHEARVMIFDERQIRLTPIEYAIMKQILQERPVTDKELIAAIFHSELNLWTKEALDKHVGNLRKKLRQSSLKLKILRVATFGYMLVLFDEMK